MPVKKRICFTSIDVEGKGIEELNEILAVFKKYALSATLFVTGEVLEKHNNLIKDWSRDYEIASHSFTHRFWNTLDSKEREIEIDKFNDSYREIFQKNPIGFRAPSHIIDKSGIELLDEKCFLYDSSIVPHYPPFKRYRGYKGKAPLSPYRIDGANILEIPVSGQILGIPLAGAWICGLPSWLYKILFLFYCPSFITLNMHSWDNLNPRFLKKLEKLLKILKNKNYQFFNGEQILQNRR